MWLWWSFWNGNVFYFLFYFLLFVLLLSFACSCATSLLVMFDIPCACVCLYLSQGETQPLSPSTTSTLTATTKKSSSFHIRQKTRHVKQHGKRQKSSRNWKKGGRFSFSSCSVKTEPVVYFSSQPPLWWWLYVYDKNWVRLVSRSFLFFCFQCWRLLLGVRVNGPSFPGR